jgi:plasmid stabilization system protein ParE
LEDVRPVRVRYRRRAERDVESIYEHIEKQNPQAATAVVARIRFAAERLGMWPYFGHAGRATGTLEWVAGGVPYIIVYEIDEATGEVAIIAVFHGAQDREYRRQE